MSSKRKFELIDFDSESDSDTNFSIGSSIGSNTNPISISDSDSECSDLIDDDNLRFDSDDDPLDSIENAMELRADEADQKLQEFLDDSNHVELVKIKKSMEKCKRVRTMQKKWKEGMEKIKEISSSFRAIEPYIFDENHRIRQFRKKKKMSKNPSEAEKASRKNDKDIAAHITNVMREKDLCNERILVLETEKLYFPCYYCAGEHPPTTTFHILGVNKQESLKINKRFDCGDEDLSKVRDCDVVLDSRIMNDVTGDSTIGSFDLIYLNNGTTLESRNAKRYNFSTSDDIKAILDSSLIDEKCLLAITLSAAEKRSGRNVSDEMIRRKNYDEVVEIITSKGFDIVDIPLNLQFRTRNVLLMFEIKRK